MLLYQKQKTYIYFQQLFLMSQDWKTSSSSPYSFRKQYENVLLSCQNSCQFSFYMLVTFCNIVLMPLFSLLSFTSTVAQLTPPLYIKRAFPPLCVVPFLLILPGVELMHFFTFFSCTCEASSIKNWFVLATGLAENLTQVVFSQPFVIQHVRTRPLTQLWNLKLLVFIYSQQHEINLWSLMLLVFLLLHTCYFEIWVTKMHE